MSKELRVLGLDAGAANMGYACVDMKDGKYDLVKYGVKGVKFDSLVGWNKYRQKIVDYWVAEWEPFIETFTPDVIFSEQMPILSGSAGSTTQMVTAMVAISVCQALNANSVRIPWNEIAVSTVKGAFFEKTEPKNIRKSKVQLRNRILENVWPNMWDLRTHILKDESDAMAVALVGAGYGRA